MASRLRVKKLSSKGPRWPQLGARRHSARDAPPAAHATGALARPSPPIGGATSDERPWWVEQRPRFVDPSSPGGEATRAEVARTLAAEGWEGVDALIEQLVPGERVGRFLVVPAHPPSIKEVIAITGTNYFRAYRWTTGRSRFPLAEFLKVIIAKRADIYTAVAWAEEWTGCQFEPLE